MINFGLKPNKSTRFHQSTTLYGDTGKIIEVSNYGFTSSPAIVEYDVDISKYKYIWVETYSTWTIGNNPAQNAMYSEQKIYLYKSLEDAEDSISKAITIDGEQWNWVPPFGEFEGYYTYRFKVSDILERVKQGYKWILY